MTYKEKLNKLYEKIRVRELKSQGGALSPKELVDNSGGYVYIVNSNWRDVEKVLQDVADLTLHKDYELILNEKPMLLFLVTNNGRARFSQVSGGKGLDIDKQLISNMKDNAFIKHVMESE